MITVAFIVILEFVSPSANAQGLLPGGSACLLNTCGPSDGIVSRECNSFCMAASHPNGTCTVTLTENGSKATSNCTCTGQRNSTLPDVIESLCTTAECEPSCMSCGYRNTSCAKNQALNGGSCICTDPNPDSRLGQMRGLLSEQ